MTIASAALDSAVEEVILPPVRDLGDGFKVRRALPSAQRRMVGPFIFLDHFGPTVFRAGNGPNVRPHPHIGLSTLTYLLEGEMVHRDSVGSVETIRPGDVNWMTAGRGIVHSERSPAKFQAQGGTMFGQQIWVALPKALEDMHPGFSNHAEGTLPGLEADGASLTIVAGEAFGHRSPVPVYSDLMYVDVVLKPDAQLQVPSQHIERAVFVVSGAIEVAGQTGTFGEAQFVIFKPGAEIVLRTRGGAHLMLVGGEPFSEPRPSIGTSSQARKIGSGRPKTTGGLVDSPKSLAKRSSSRCRPIRRTSTTPVIPRRRTRSSNGTLDVERRKMSAESTEYDALMQANLAGCSASAMRPAG